MLNNIKLFCTIGIYLQEQEETGRRMSNKYKPSPSVIVSQSGVSFSIHTGS